MLRFTEDDIPTHPDSGWEDMPPDEWQKFRQVLLGMEVPEPWLTDEQLHRGGYENWKECYLYMSLGNR